VKFPVQKKRLIAVGLYTVFGAFCLLVSLYWTFPATALGQRLSHEIARQTQGAWHVTFGRVSTYRLSGILAEDITLKRDIPVDSPLSLQLEAVHARLRLTPLLLARTSFDIGMPWGQNGALGVRLMPHSSTASTLPAGAAEGYFDTVDLATPPILAKLAGLPFGGVVDGDYAVDSDGNVRKVVGNATLRIARLSVGPGSVAGFTLPQVDLGTVEMTWEVKDGRAKLTNFKQTGGSLALKVQATIDLAAPLAASRGDFCVQFRAEPAFLNANPKMRTVLQLAEVQLKKDAEGFLHLPMSGPLTQPVMHPGLCRRSN
jgi:type II secretion system protein N